jgi:hypothetical protein
MVEHVGHPAHTEADGRPAGPGYEALDANPRSLLRAGVALVVVVAAVLFGLRGMVGLMFPGRVERPHPRPQISSLVPDRGLVVLPSLAEQMKQLRESGTSALGSYGWVDRKAGVVRIPIERAMDLIAERGVPRGKGPRTEVELNSRKGAQK